MTPRWPPIPAHITLAAIRYEIRIEPNLAAGEGEFGHTSFHRQLITLDGSSPLPIQWATLCHEVLHLIDYHLSLGFDEPTIHRVSCGVFEFISLLLAWEQGEASENR